MHEAVDDVIQRRQGDPAGLSRAMSVSLAVHVFLVVVLFVVPKDWLVTAKTPPLIMTISLGGSPGPKSGGMVAAGARPVEEVAPPPKRMEPIPAAAPPKSSTLVIPTKPTKTPPPKPSKDTELTPSVLNRPPTTGAQPTKGTSAAETRSTTQSTGLTFGGGGAGDTQVKVDSDFCCPEYIKEFQRRILVNWERTKDQPEAGTITLVFEILKDGTFTTPQIEKTNGSVLLEIASKSAFRDLKLQPLPKEYKEDRLKIHLSFPYVR
jgi:outer membrane biosynthesis protein TonB